MPEPARVLVAATRDGDGARHGVHARVRVLQRRDGPARSRRRRDEPERLARGGRRARPAPRRDHLGRPRRPRGRRRRALRALHRARSARAAPDTTIEILTPDFRHKDGAIERVAAARPDVYNHNVETVPRLYRRIRPGASFAHSVELLRRVKRCEPATFTKSGLMVGLGEEPDEVLEVMDALRAADVDFLTIGQYLRPTPRHAPVARYVDPAEFAELPRGRARARASCSCPRLRSRARPTMPMQISSSCAPRAPQRRALTPESSDGRSAARQRSPGNPGVARRARVGARARGRGARALPDRAADRQGAPLGRAPALQGHHRLSQHDPRRTTRRCRRASRASSTGSARSSAGTRSRWSCRPTARAPSSAATSRASRARPRSTTSASTTSSTRPPTTSWATCSTSRATARRASTRARFSRAGSASSRCTASARRSASAGSPRIRTRG